MRTSRLSAALGLFVSLIPAQLPAQPASEDVARWRAGLKTQEERLRRQEWKTAAKSARDMVEEMVDGFLLVGRAPATMLALAVVQQAVAESGLGHQEEAVWLLRITKEISCVKGSLVASQEDFEAGRLIDAEEVLKELRAS